MKARKANALFGLDRLDEEARDIARAALAQLPGKPGEDRATANLVLSRIAERRLDFAQARVHAEAALAAAVGTSDREIAALVMAVRASMFDAGPDALAYADRLVAAVSARPGVKPRDTTDARTLRARVLLNHGDVPQAYAELKRVLADRGGLGLKVSLADVVMRSDLAIAALLAHGSDNARKYLAFTGAGRLNGSPFRRAASIDLPPCDPAGGLRPDDIAVVEFAIDAQGVVIAATPIYGSRNGPTAAAFAEAVSGWSWKPEEVAKIPPSFVP